MPSSSSELCPRRPFNEAMARTLRHEVGDFLNKVYATVAILQYRLPADMTLERDVISRLRQRAEDCKILLDVFQDYLCPLRLACEPVDLAALAARLAESARPKHPDVEIHLEATAEPTPAADPQRVAQIGESLLANACESGARHVVFRTAEADGMAVWSISDDGPGVPSEDADRLFEPFFTMRAGHAGLGLALTRKLVELHGGQVLAGNKAEGGFEVSVRLPVHASVCTRRAFD